MEFKSLPNLAEPVGFSIRLRSPHMARELAECIGRAFAARVVVVLAIVRDGAPVAYVVGDATGAEAATQIGYFADGFIFGHLANDF